MAPVFAFTSRIMGIEPKRIEYISLSNGRLGQFDAGLIEQRGERVEDVMKKFKLLDFIPAHRRILGID